MKFKIYQAFRIIVIPTKMNKDLVTKLTVFDYVNEQVLSEKDGLPFKVLRDIYLGDLVHHWEYEIIANLPIFVGQDKKDRVYQLKSVSAIEINEFSQLQGNNPLNYPFLEVIEE